MRAMRPDAVRRQAMREAEPAWFGLVRAYFGFDPFFDPFDLQGPIYPGRSRALGLIAS